MLPVCEREGHAELAPLPPPPSPLGLGSGVGREAEGLEHAAHPAGPGEGQTVARDQGGGWVGG